MLMYREVAGSVSGMCSKMFHHNKCSTRSVHFEVYDSYTESFRSVSLTVLLFHMLLRSRHNTMLSGLLELVFGKWQSTRNCAVKGVWLWVAGGRGFGVQRAQMD